MDRADTFGPIDGLLAAQSEPGSQSPQPWPVVLFGRSFAGQNLPSHNAPGASIQYIHADNPYEAVAQLLSSPSLALVIDLDSLHRRHLKLLDVAQGVEVFGVGTMPRGIEPKELFDVRFVTKAELPGLLEKLAQAQQVQAGSVTAEPQAQTQPGSQVQPDPEPQVQAQTEPQIQAQPEPQVQAQPELVEQPLPVQDEPVEQPLPEVAAKVATKVERKSPSYDDGEEQSLVEAVADEPEEPSKPAPRHVHKSKNEPIRPGDVLSPQELSALLERDNEQ